jgi:hypothetical protein
MILERLSSRLLAHNFQTDFLETLKLGNSSNAAPKLPNRKLQKTVNFCMFWFCQLLQGAPKIPPIFKRGFLPPSLF